MSLEQVGRAAEMLEELWLSEIVQQRASRLLWDELRGPLARYRVAPWIEVWYRDSILAGCRRLLDKDGRAVSLVRALQLLRDNAQHVTDDWVVQARAQHANDYVRGELEQLARADLESVGLIGASGLQLDPAAVEESLEQLEVAGREIRVLATRIVAHRDPQDKPAVTEVHVQTLLDHVADIHARWYRLVTGAEVSLRVDHLVRASEFVLALNLYDRKAYLLALSEAERQLGPAAPPEAYEHVRTSARVRYEFG
ncbi:MAG: hypothetical protein KY469_06260 [Actinobacteria bacterium]|nr:hypothetical protein [Actinomycetota bacterium]